MFIKRKETKIISIGNLKIGGTNPIAIQSMTNTDTRNIKETVEQIIKLENIGCEIIRVAVPNMESAEAIKEIKKQIHIPLVADIHFDYKLALKSIENGVDKLRINPGNIGDKNKVKEIVIVAKNKNIPIRIGVNSGSLEKDLLNKYNGVTSDALVESVMKHVQILEDLDFNNIVLSIKSSSIQTSLEAYSALSKITDYPLHIGITESGTIYSGTIKSSVGIGSMLSMGIGDTLRVSLTGDPLEEIKCAKEILKSIGLRKFGAEMISCPTCGRTEIDLISLANSVEQEIYNIEKPLKVAVMGCVVNGPGEAKDADIGIAGGKGFGIIFKKGQIVKKVHESVLFEEFKNELYKIT